MSSIYTTTHLLARKTDLRPSLDEIENQGPAGVCTGEGLVKVLEVESGRVHDVYPSVPQERFSVLYNYYWSGNFEGRVGEEGRSPENAFIAALIKGVCRESSWPWDLSKLDIQPPVSCDIEALKFKVREYAKLTAGTGPSDWGLAAETTRNNIKHAICQGRPVGVSFTVTENFRTQWNLQHNWRTFHWDTRPSPSNPIVGGHEVVLIGYDEDYQMFLAQNSWDRGCDGGFFGMPYSNFADLSWGVSSAFCTVWDAIGHIPVSDYLPIVYDPAQQKIISDFIGGKLGEITTAANTYGISGAQVDSAMKWEAGLSNRLFGN